MSVIELQRDLEFFPDQRLTELAQQGGNDRYPGWLIDAEMQRRVGLRERHESEQAKQQAANPQDITTQLVAELQDGIGGIPGQGGEASGPELQQGIPSADMSQMAQGPMPQQPPMMVAGGGLIPGYHMGGGVGEIPFHLHGPQEGRHGYRDDPGPDWRPPPKREPIPVTAGLMKGLDWLRASPVGQYLAGEKEGYGGKEIVEDLPGEGVSLDDDDMWHDEGLWGDLSANRLSQPKPVDFDPPSLLPSPSLSHLETPRSIQDILSDLSIKYPPDAGGQSVDGTSADIFTAPTYDELSGASAWEEAVGNRRAWADPEDPEPDETQPKVKLGGISFQQHPLNQNNQRYSPVDLENLRGFLPGKEWEKRDETQHSPSRMPTPPSKRDETKSGDEEATAEKNAATRGGWTAPAWDPIKGYEGYFADIFDRQDATGEENPEKEDLLGRLTQPDPLQRAESRIEELRNYEFDRTELNKLLTEGSEEKIKRALAEAEFRARRTGYLRSLIPGDKEKNLRRQSDWLSGIASIFSGPERDIAKRTKTFLSERDSSERARIEREKQAFGEIYDLENLSRSEISTARNALRDGKITIEREKIQRGEERALEALKAYVDLSVADLRESGMDRRHVLHMATLVKNAIGDQQARLSAAKASAGAAGLSPQQEIELKLKNIESAYRTYLGIRVAEPEALGRMTDEGKQRYLASMRLFVGSLVPTMDAASIEMLRSMGADDKTIKFFLASASKKGFEDWEDWTADNNQPS